LKQKLLALSQQQSKLRNTPKPRKGIKAKNSNKLRAIGNSQLFFFAGSMIPHKKRESLPGYSLLDIGYSISTQHRISTKILLEANNPRLATKHGYPTSES